MAKFDKVKSSASEVAKKEAVKSSVPTVSMNILLENLILDPENGEDITNTADLEYSIKRFGFRGNIEVTDFGCENGKYMIISGHRRYATLKKLGYESVPCIVYQFESETDILDYNQCMNNANRDSARDPLMWIDRYINNRKVLLRQTPNMKEGALSEELAKRFSMSKQQIERYKALTKVLPTILELAREGYIGIFSLVPLAPLTEEQQNDIYGIFMDALEELRVEGENEVITRPVVNDIIKAYKNDGVKTWDDYKAKREATVEVNEPSTDAVEESGFNGMNEPVEAEESADGEAEESGSTGEAGNGNGADDFSEDKGDGEAKEVKQGKAIMSLVTKLDTAIQENYVYADDESRIVAITSMGKLIESLINEMNNVALDCTDGGWDAFMVARKGIKDGLDGTAQ